MTEISRIALFGKLNPLAYKAIESATVFCKMRGNPYVELVHWLNQILQGQDSDLHRIIHRFGLDPAGLARDFTEALDRLPRGSRSLSDLSADVEEAAERGWTFATLLFGEPQVRTGYLVVGILKTRGLRSALLGISRLFEKVQTDALTEGFGEICAGSPEERMMASDGFHLGVAAAPGEASEAMAPAQMGKQQALGNSRSI
jgi:type VI secretion system protein VasG